MGGGFRRACPHQGYRPSHLIDHWLTTAEISGMTLGPCRGRGTKNKGQKKNPQTKTKSKVFLAFVYHRYPQKRKTGSYTLRCRMALKRMTTFRWWREQALVRQTHLMFRCFLYGKAIPIANPHLDERSLQTTFTGLVRTMGTDFVSHFTSRNHQRRSLEGTPLYTNAGDFLRTLRLSNQQTVGVPFVNRTPNADSPRGHRHSLR